MRTTPLELLAGREARLCRRANHYCRRRRVRRLFSVISRLGDGVFWYVLMGALVLLDGFDGLRASVHMAATGLAALLLYKASSAGPGVPARMRPICASVPGWHRWTSSASPPGTPCTRCRSPSSRWPTTRGWHRCWFPSPSASRCRGWYWACTTRPMY